MHFDISFGSGVVIGLIALINLAIVITATRMEINYEFSQRVLGGRFIEFIWTILPVGLVVTLIWLSFKT
ncbi:MAG: hypothetical protein CL763_02990 [Chloroflexi bacterium]|nr:hypothetical protein [Chloroflexota bacterium]